MTKFGDSVSLFLLLMRGLVAILSVILLARLGDVHGGGMYLLELPSSSWSKLVPVPHPPSRSSLVNIVPLRLGGGDRLAPHWEMSSDREMFCNWETSSSRRWEDITH